MSSVIPPLTAIFWSGTVHGLAFWFDVAFIGANATVWLSTAPTQPLTHWYQVCSSQPFSYLSLFILKGGFLLIKPSTYLQFFSLSDPHWRIRPSFGLDPDPTFLFAIILNEPLQCGEFMQKSLFRYDLLTDKK